MSSSLLRPIERLRNSSLFFRRMVPPMAKIARYAAPNRQTEYSALLEEHITRRPDKPALIGEGTSLTWAQLDRLANRVAGWALAEGLRRGDVVALLMENRPEYVAIWLGLSRLGVVTALVAVAVHAFVDFNHQIPAKVYEYIAAGQPIVALTPPDSDTASVVRDSGGQYIADLDDAAQKITASKIFATCGCTYRA